MPSRETDQLGQALVSVRPRQIGAMPLVYPILNDLDLCQTTNILVPCQADIDLGRVMVLMVLNHLLAPQPLYHVQDWLAETVLPELLGVAADKVYDNRLGRALDQLHAHLGELWAAQVSRAIQIYDLDLNILHWDITSLYFEGAYTDSELATYGYSRDQRPDSKQVNLEVDVTHDGYVPVVYHVLPGDTADISRPIPHLRALLRFLARPELSERNLRPLLVSDCKMVTAEAVLACHQHSLFYLGPLPNGNATEALLRSVSAEELSVHPLSYRPQRVRTSDPNFIPYQGIWRQFTFEHEGKRVTDRALVIWSAGKSHLDEQKRKTYLKRLLDGLAHIRNQLNTRRYKKRAYVEQRLAVIQQNNPVKGMVDIQLTGEDGRLEFTFRVNRQRLTDSRALDGRYALVTNAHHLDAHQALTVFKGQDGVEKRFRVVKGPLVIRPLFVRSDRRIEGLVFITLLALLVRAILERICYQQGLKVTAEQLFQQFASLQAVDLTWSDGSIQRRAAEMTPFQRQVLGTLGWPQPEMYARLPEVER